MISPINFKGNFSPYINYKGFSVTPITKKPTQEDLESALTATTYGKPLSGVNGDAFFYGQDLVVKRYKPIGEALSFDPNREIRAFQSLNEKGIKNPNFQQGLFAFTTPSDDSYLVSTRVFGLNPNYEESKFNKQNLAALISLISYLDMPRKLENEKIFPFEVALHYDLRPNNILISDDKAGLVDFEHLEYDDLDKRIFRNMLGLKTIHSDFSDIAGIPSNLRNFESRTICNYLLDTPSEEAQEIFKMYLSEKSSKYHNVRSKYFKEQQKIALEERNKELAFLCEILSEKEKGHAIVLNSPNNDVLKSEAIKIQMSYFTRMQSIFTVSDNAKINPKQVTEYLESAIQFFTEMHKKSNGYQKNYYEDCLRFTENWKTVVSRIQTKARLVSEMPHLTTAKEIEEYNNTHKPDKYNDLLIFKNKLTNSYPKTLDSHLLLTN